jgi:putative flippase GtrA
MRELLQSPFACGTTVAYADSGKSLDLKTFASAFPLLRQAVRYGFVGVLHNLLGYLLYLLITFFGVDPKLAITILYPVGATAAYFGHSKYSFSYRGRYAHALPRYALAHVAGYGVNFAMLFVLSDTLKLPHQAVQASAIVVVAGVLFLLSRYFIFPRSEHGDVIKP